MRASRLLNTLAGAALLLPVTASAAAQETIPMVGRDGPALDGCGAVGKVYRLNPKGDNFLAVRNAPRSDGLEKDRLDPGTLVWLCDAADEWQGIVYAKGEYQDLGDCRVSTPVAEPEPYRGPCQHGWVHGRYVELVAG